MGVIMVYYKCPLGSWCDSECKWYNKHLRDCNLNIMVKAICDLNDKFNYTSPSTITLTSEGMQVNFKGEEE